MNSRIILVRHGVTEWNYAGRVQGRSDIPLAPEGVRQAEAVAGRLAGERWDAVYSSPLKRAYETALSISRRVGQSQVTTDARLVERHMGEAEGLSDVDLPRLWPNVPWDSLPGMEPPCTLAARAQEALAEMAVRHPDGRLICVAHGSLISRFLRSFVHPDATMATYPRTGSITTVLYDGQRFRLESGPDYSHMLQDGVEYSGEKGRVSSAELESLLVGLQLSPTALEAVVWGATAIETARVNDQLVGFARAFTDGVLYGCIDIAAVRPGFEQVRSVLIQRLQARYPHVLLSVCLAI